MLACSAQLKVGGRGDGSRHPGLVDATPRAGGGLDHARVLPHKQGAVLCAVIVRVSGESNRNDQTFSELCMTI